MRVFWTDAALGQLEAIRDYLAQTSPDYAQRVVERLVKRSEQIAAFPHSGRMVPEYEIDEVRKSSKAHTALSTSSKKIKLECSPSFTPRAGACRRMNDWFGIFALVFQ